MKKPDERLLNSKFCNRNRVRDDATRNIDKRKWETGYDGIRWNSKKVKK